MFSSKPNENSEVLEYRTFDRTHKWKLAIEGPEGNRRAAVCNQIPGAAFIEVNNCRLDEQGFKHINQKGNYVVICNL